MKLRFTPKAIQDLESIDLYLRQVDAQSPGRVRSDILETCELLAEFPLMGRRQVTPGVRKFVTRRFSYVIYYRAALRSETVEILAIRHAARQRPFSDA